jgi:putative membrane protein
MLGGGGMMMDMFAAAFGGVVLIIFGILAAIEFVIAGALFSGKRWGRIIVIIFSIIGVIFGAASLAMGDVISIATIILDIIVLWYMWRPHVIAYFNGAYQTETMTKTSLDIIKERYAKGEITKEEFEEKKKDLE